MEAPELHLLATALNARLAAHPLTSFSLLAAREGEALDATPMMGTICTARVSGKALMLGSFAIRFGMKGWLALYDPAAPVAARRSPEEEKEATDRMTASEKRAYHHAQTNLLPVPLKQAVAAAPLRVFGADEVDKVHNNKRYEWAFEGGLRLVLADDSKSATVTLGPAGEAVDVCSIESAEAVQAAIRGIVKQDRTKFAVLLKNTLFAGAGEPLVSEIFHAARMSPYVAVRDVRDNEAACAAISEAIYAVPRARLQGASFSVYGRERCGDDAVEVKPGFGVANFHFVRSGWAHVPADANSENKHRREVEAEARAAPRKRVAKEARAEGKRRPRKGAAAPATA